MNEFFPRHCPISYLQNTENCLITHQVSSLLRKIEKIQNMMYHLSQLAIAIRGEQWLDTKYNNYNNNTIKILSRINYYRTIH